MNWLLHNPIADMRGPEFLKLYFVAAGTIVLAARFRLQSLDPTRAMPVPQVPAELDPYEIAFLRGGENELLRLRILDLVQRGYLEADPKAETISQRAQHPGTRHLTKAERLVFKEFEQKKKISGLFAKGGLPDELSKTGPDYAAKLTEAKLLMPKEVASAATKTGLTAALCVAALGGYKLIVALAKGHTNVGYLVLMMAVSLAALGITSNTSRLSRLGSAYLDRLRLTLDAWKEKAADSSAKVSDDTLMLLASVFGIGVLAGTLYDYYPKLFKRAAASSDTGSWVSTSSCGSSCSSSSSSCSSCGGGGCGGCGGGGD